MRIDRIHVEGFGRLAGFDTGPTLLEGLVVVLGPNEAGKSTLFTFLTTALYGFLPATRERNPHVPWGAEEAAGRVHIRLDTGGCADVERRLRSQPSGHMTIEGRPDDLRNQPLPWVEHVPRTVFRQVFAVTLGDLAGLDGETWARIQDKVVGSMGASDLRSARAAADALEREAGEIWRPNRRGNQRLRDVQGQIRALRARRGAAHERDAKVRDLVEQRERAVARLLEVREERQRDRMAVERAQSLLPAKRQLERIAALREEGGPVDELQGLPGDPLARLEELAEACARLEGRRDAIDAQLAELEASLEAFDDRARDILAHRDEIAQLSAVAAGCAPDRVRTVELRSAIADLEARLDGASEQVLSTPWREVPAEALLGVSVDLLRDRIHRTSGARPREEATPTRGVLLVSGGAAVVLGGALLAWGLARGSLSATAAGAAITAAGLTALAAQLRRGEVGAAAPGGVAEVSDLLGNLPLATAHRRAPGEGLVSSLARVQELMREREQRTRALEGARARVAGVDAAALDLAGRLGLDASGDADAVARQLDRAARSAERLEDAALLAERESRRLARERQSVAAELTSRVAERAALEQVGVGFGRGDPARGLEIARARLAAHHRADQLTEELERTHPRLEELAAEIAEARPPSGDDVALARARLEAHEEEIERLVKHAEALERDAAHLRETETVDAVDGEAASLRDTEARLVRERDRKWVLAQVLREADRRFREEHQPDLVRRAGSYLAHLNGGRYERLVVDETADSNLFHLVGPGLPAPVPLAPPVSTGTLEQAYLSLRLAIVDHLDQGGERLPLFVDEVFVNWDHERRLRGLEVLAGIAAERQVFVFTCHPAVADDLERRGGRVLRLSGAE
jgi:uncharacterized protein YhaN